MPKAKRKPVVEKPKIRGPRRRKATVKVFRIDGPTIHLDRLCRKIFKRR